MINQYIKSLCWGVYLSSARLTNLGIRDNKSIPPIIMLGLIKSIPTYINFRVRVNKPIP